MIAAIRQMLRRLLKSSVPTRANNRRDLSNLGLKVARGFGREWSTFRQDTDHLPQLQRQEIFDDYFEFFRGICCRRTAASALMSAAAPDAGRCLSRRT